MKPLMTLLRSWGVRIIIYTDNMLILADSKEEANTTPQSPDVSAGGPGVHGQPREVPPMPLLGDRIPRVTCGFTECSALTPWEDETDLQGSLGAHPEGVCQLVVFFSS